MIDKNGALRCDSCGKMVLLRVTLVEGEIKWYCPDSRCHYYQTVKASTSQVAGNLTNLSEGAIYKNVG